MHVTCVAHLLHNCAMRVRAHFKNIDEVIVNNDGNIQIVGVHWEPVDLHRLAVYLTSS